MRFIKRKNPGFTLVEMIIYVAIFAVILFVIIQLFWQMQISDIRGRTSREVKENVMQVMEIVKYNVRGADDINEESCVFNSHPGTLSIQEDSTVVIDTYLKDIVIDGRTNTIRKLRYTYGSNPSIDLTSDKVDVENFVLRYLTQKSNPDIVGLELTISYLNPGDDYLFDQSISVNTGVLIRKEI